jgi:hypothetical protein
MGRVSTAMCTTIKLASRTLTTTVNQNVVVRLPGIPLSEGKYPRRQIYKSAA